MDDVLMYSCGIVCLMYVSHLLCNVDVMISTSAKAFQYAVLSLGGPSSLFRIVSHIGCDKLVPEPRPTIGAPLIVGRC